MASRRGLVLALLCTTLAAVIAWQLGWFAPVPPPPPAAPRPSPQPPPPPFQSAWATEQDWIVDTITRDVREMATFVTSRSLPDDPGPAIEAGALSFEDHVFSPAVYAPLAAETLASSGTVAVPRASSTSEDARLLSALLDLRAEVLVRESEKVSRRLEAEPADPDAHERAALVLGAFMLREAAGRYWDLRPGLCRMTAHLALAHALRDGAEPGLAGRFDEALLDTLVRRERDALAHLDALQAAAGSRAERAWVRALRLRNTGDYRIARNVRDLTLLEKLEEFAALVASLDDLEALDWLGQRTQEPIPDWARTVLSGGFSVETGNRFAPMAAAAEMAEAAEVWTALGHEPFDDMDGFLEALNARPQRFLVRGEDGRVHAAVLGWGLWADSAQRHLIFALVQEAYRLGAVLGRSGAEEAFVERARAFSRLELFPLFLRNVAVDAERYRPAMAAARELALRSPERLTSGMWTLLRAEERYAPLPADLPDERTWFRPTLLPGTLLGYHYPGWLSELVAHDPEHFQELRELAPYNVTLAEFATELIPANERSVANLVPLYGPLADFSVYVMGDLTDAAWYDPPEFRRRQGALCDLLPYKCFHLGYRLAELGYPDEAAVAYQKGFDRTRDRVAAANQSAWLVQYYFKRGELAKAEDVARRSAETSSAAGLEVMARLLERTDRLAEAEKLYRRIYETYDSATEMTGFYYRQARVAGNADYEARFRESLALAQPSGLEPLDRAALPAEPTDGVVVKKENDNTKRYGIKWGNVIVGLDGFRVRDTHAFSVVRELSYSPRMKLLIWRGQSYDEVEAELWDRRFRIDIEDLNPKK